MFYTRPYCYQHQSKISKSRYFSCWCIWPPSHLWLFFHYPIKLKKNAKQLKPRRFFHGKKKDEFLVNLQKNFKNIPSNLDPNKLMDKILLCTSDAINCTFPKQIPSHNINKRITNPWVNKEFLKAQSIRDKLKLKWIKSGKVANSPLHCECKRQARSQNFFLFYCSFCWSRTQRISQFWQNV